MYLVLLEKDGQEVAYSTMDRAPNANYQKKHLQIIADQTGYPVIARFVSWSMHPDLNSGLEEIRVEPQKGVIKSNER